MARERNNLTFCKGSPQKNSSERSKLVPKNDHLNPEIGEFIKTFNNPFIDTMKSPLDKN
jgi:hypothetical protein